ncbi:hypothetical protein L873DRAFT_1785238 [Choiromyces venosus 120613-1]|uniref:Uncharacterized protein n=1 Tax=Choiromyces venosus 120613-1 TaxID=1336337 RepID=A0A3N4K9K5_9PEZI|nr:hypothetical protein L873DRAFT_1785238 [Choiromyces venosus 120613-1]
MVVNSIPFNEAAPGGHHKKKSVFGAVAYVDVACVREPPQNPPALSSQEYFPTLTGQKLPNAPLGVWSNSGPFSANMAGGMPTRSGPSSSRELSPAICRRNIQLHQQSYPALGSMAGNSGSQGKPREAQGQGSEEGSWPQKESSWASILKGKGKVTSHQGCYDDSKNALTPTVAGLDGFSSVRGSVVLALPTLRPTPRPTLPPTIPLRIPYKFFAHYQRPTNNNPQPKIRPGYFHKTMSRDPESTSLYSPLSMTSHPPSSSSPSLPRSFRGVSLPNTPMEDLTPRDMAIYENSTLLADAQRLHEAEMDNIFGPNLIITSSPEGHYMCGLALEDLEAKNVLLEAEIEALRDHSALLEQRAVGPRPEQNASFGNFVEMVREISDLRGIADRVESLVEIAKTAQEQVAVLRARLVENGIDLEIPAGPVTVAEDPQEPATPASPDIQAEPVSVSAVPVAPEASSSDSVRPSEENSRFPSNKYFFGELGILFRSISNLGRCNYQFSRQMPVTNVQIPPRVRAKLKAMVQGDEELLDWLLDDANKTKFLVVSGLFARLIYCEVMDRCFIENLIMKMGAPSSQRATIVSGWVHNNPEITEKVWLTLTDMCESLGEHLHTKYVSLLSRPTDARHLEESLRALVGCIEQAARLALGMDYLGWENWKFRFPQSSTPYSASTMTVCDLGTEGLLNFEHETSSLEERHALIKLCIFPFVLRRDHSGDWVLIGKATALI